MQVTRFVSARRNQVFQCRPTPTLLARSDLRERSAFEYDLMRAALINPGLYSGYRPFQLIFRSRTSYKRMKLRSRPAALRSPCRVPMPQASLCHCCSIAAMLLVYLVGAAAVADMCLLRLKRSEHGTACESD
jgi:hypothetical protein